MFHQSRIIKSLSPIVLLAGLLHQAQAHEVQTSSEVGGTFHIEPNDNPRSGEPVTAWFALTRQGGEAIPLAQCKCKLAVYPEPYTPGSAPLMLPPLKGLSTSEYQDIPAAKLVFPIYGIYQLVLSGTPRSGASFKPFDLHYTVTVSPGTPVPLKTIKDEIHNTEVGSSQKTASHQPSVQQLMLALVSAVVLGTGSLWFVIKKLNNKDK